MSVLGLGYLAVPWSRDVNESGSLSFNVSGVVGVNPVITSFQPNKGGSSGSPISANESNTKLTSTATNATTCTLSPQGTGPQTQACLGPTCLLDWPITVGSTTIYVLGCYNSN